ncbi:MAG: AAA family ATPase [Bacillota bacterium]
MADRLATVVREVEQEVGRVMVGQRDVVRQVLTTILAGGHALLEGVPGLGKTVMVRTFGQVFDLKFSRIQFTPDLMPADIVGTNVIAEDASGSRRFEFQPGPIFSNLVLADEINRATPKTQSAMLEAMQEKQVTVGTATRPLPKPFFVLATQNPIEMEGTYPLPEAQLDRFFFKVLVRFPSAEELGEIVRRTTTGHEETLKRAATGEDILALGRLARDVPIAEPVTDYAVRLLMATHPQGSPSKKAAQFVRYGASPRGLQTLVLAAKIRALLEGRFNVAFEDLREAAFPALRHRFFLNFEGEAEGLSTDQVIADILESVPAGPR